LNIRVGADNCGFENRRIGRDDDIDLENRFFVVPRADKSIKKQNKNTYYTTYTTRLLLPCREPYRAMRMSLRAVRAHAYYRAVESRAFHRAGARGLSLQLSSSPALSLYLVSLCPVAGDQFSNDIIGHAHNRIFFNSGHTFVRQQRDTRYVSSRAHGTG